MSQGPQRDEGNEESISRRYVHALSDSEEPRWGELLHSNFERLPETERRPFLHALARDARQVADADLEFLLYPGLLAGWRERLTAAWLMGLTRRTRFRESLGRLLLDSDLVYAGQGYCFALARFGQFADAEILVAYLDRYLPQRDCHYDQAWALGGLLQLDSALGTGYAEKYLTPGGLWSRSSFAGTDPSECRRRMTALIDLADEAMEATS